jgi:hypothetical protein
MSEPHLFYYVCRRGDMSSVISMINNGENNWNGGLIGACAGGHRYIVKLLIDKGATAWLYIFNNACKSGDLVIVKMIVDKCGNMLNKYEWWLGMVHALRQKHKDVAEFLLPNCTLDRRIIFLAGSIDLIVRIVYKTVLNDIRVIRFDVVEFLKEPLEMNCQVKVKLFDRNLFGSFSKIRNKRKRKFEYVV